jgi:hypothetical protein
MNKFISEGSKVRALGKVLIFLIGGVLLIIFGYVIGNFYPLSFSDEEENGGVYCTMDAKLCPDGSYVGRVAPNCDFAPCPSVKTGILKGKVSIGPLCPVEPCPVAIANPYASRAIIINKQTGELLFSIPLDEDGSFETEIAAGNYNLDLSDCSFLGCRYSLPKTIKIEENKTAEINIDIDTGIR